MHTMATCTPCVPRVPRVPRGLISYLRCREDPQGHAIKVAKILDDRATINDQYKLYDVVKANRSPEVCRGYVY